MNKQILTFLSSLILLFFSCNNSKEGNQKIENKDVAIKAPNLNKIVIGQWKTEGNEGVVPKWIEFDSLNNEFYSWVEDEVKPSNFSGSFKIIGDTVIQFIYAEFNEKQQYKINSINKDKLDIISLGISTGSIVYNKTVYVEKEIQKVENDTLPVVGILKSVQESDFWGRVYLYVDINGDSKSFEYYDFDMGAKFNEARKMVNKKVSIHFKAEVTLEEIDLHVNNSTIHGEYGRIKNEKDKKASGGSSIEGTLIVHEYDKSGDLPSGYRILDSEGDTTYISAFVYDDHVALNGKKATVYYVQNTKQLVESITSLEEEKPIADAIFIGQWKKEDTSNPIDPTSIEIEKESENGYTIKFSNEDYFIQANNTLNILKGENGSGNFVMEIISENPPIISYSDDGRGHFEPVVNELFVKVKSYKDFLIGKWQSTDDENNFVEYTLTNQIETNIDYKNSEPYKLSSTCMNEKIPMPNGGSIETKYISGITSEMCWGIEQLDENKLVLIYMGGRGNELSYIRVK